MNARFAWALAALVGSAALGQGVYERRGSALETWYASLAAGRAEVTLGPWHYLGPFDHRERRGFAAVYPPEQGVDLSAEVEGKGGRRLRWRDGSGFRDNQTNDLRIFDDNDWIAVYLHRVIQSPDEREVPVLLGSDDGIKVWLNGELLLEHEVSRACRLGDERVVLRLRRGDNQLLLKIVQGEGPSGFAFGLDQRPEDLLRRIAADFPDEIHDLMVELDWLRQDGLAGDDADFAAGARRALQLARDTARLVESPAQYLADLEALTARCEAQPEQAREIYLEARRLRRAALLAHSALGFETLLINQHPPPLYSHMCDQYLGRHSRPGPGLVLLENWRERPRARPLLAGRLPTGSVLHPDLSFDGRRVVFSFCDHTVAPPEDRAFHLYEASLDGTELRAITSDPDSSDSPLRRRAVVEDWDPCYLPDGGIAFVSTRNRGFGRCHGGRYVPAYVLHRVEPDGTGLRRISFGEANEWDPGVLPNGLIIYSRWDYINRHDTLYQGLWTTRPDGTGAAHYYGNYTRNPCMIAEPQAIWGTNKVVATATAHHSYTAGSLLVIDPSLGEDGDAPLARLTPEAVFPETEGWPQVTYATPTPVTVDLYLAAFSPYPHVVQGNIQRAEAYGIYLVDTAGGRELIYRDPEMSSFSPLPVRPRPMPPALPPAVDHAQSTGTFFVGNVYRSTEPLEPGSVRRLRVIEILPQPTAAVPVRSRVENEVVKRVVGTVAVEPDGSVAFRAPAETSLMFQLLDARGLAVMTMRSQVYLQPGEQASCVGCHEPRMSAPPPQLRPSPVRDLTPPPGPAYTGGLSFARTVQPVLDRYCIGCHGLKGEAGGISLLGTPAGAFSQAYECLTGRDGLVFLAHRNQETAQSRPYDYGAHAGRLAGLLADGHHGVSLDPESFERIAMWLDVNGQYYGDYEFDRPERRPPNPDGVHALREHLRQACGRCHESLADEPEAALLNPAQPDESRVLQAPLAKSAGGWGACPAGWASIHVSGCRAMRDLVAVACDAEN